MPARRDRVSVLVLSVWIEDGWPDEGSDGGFRARITAGSDCALRVPGLDARQWTKTPGPSGPHVRRALQPSPSAGQTQLDDHSFAPYRPPEEVHHPCDRDRRP